MLCLCTSLSINYLIIWMDNPWAHPNPHRLLMYEAALALNPSIPTTNCQVITEVPVFFAVEGYLVHKIRE